MCIRHGQPCHLLGIQLQNVPNRRYPGSWRDWTAFSSINWMNSSKRSGWISAWTITANGLAFRDMLRVTKLLGGDDKVLCNGTNPEAPRRVMANSDDRSNTFMDRTESSRRLWLAPPTSMKHSLTYNSTLEFSYQIRLVWLETDATTIILHYTGF